MTPIVFDVPDERGAFMLELLHSMGFVSNIRARPSTGKAAKALLGKIADTSKGAEPTK